MANFWQDVNRYYTTCQFSLIGRFKVKKKRKMHCYRAGVANEGIINAFSYNTQSKTIFSFMTNDLQILNLEDGTNKKKRTLFYFLFL